MEESEYQTPISVPIKIVSLATKKGGTVNR
jgi:hypothetical protein